MGAALCIIPDNDLFNAINENKAAIVTDTIDEFYEDGVILKSEIKSRQILLFLRQV